MRVRLKRILALCVVLTLLLPAHASAETEAELKRRLESLKSETRSAGEAFDRAHWALDETDVKIARTDKRLRSTSKKLVLAKRRLNKHANSIYRREGLELLDFLVGASSFEDFITRFEYLNRIGLSDADVVSEVKDPQAELRDTRAELKEERRSRAADTKRLKSRLDKLEGRLRDREAEFKALKARLDALRSGGSIPSDVAAVPGPNGMVFPVVGSYYYSNTWGASRSGGRRRHQGTDIMAPRGTPLVAILSGTVRSKNNGLGGKTIWLTADNGWQFYYAHLDTWVVKSGRVKAGQVIATCGSTGNASGGAPHLHLQVHPNGGGPVNPYPYLRQME